MSKYNHIYYHTRRDLFAFPSYTGLGLRSLKLLQCFYIISEIEGEWINDLKFGKKMVRNMTIIEHESIWLKWLKVSGGNDVCDLIPFIVVSKCSGDTSSNTLESPFSLHVTCFTFVEMHDFDTQTVNSRALETIAPLDHLDTTVYKKTLWKKVTWQGR